MCEATIGDYTSLAQKDDNCTAPGQILTTQKPASGFVVNGDLTVQTVWLIADDGNGNVDSCSFDFQVEDRTDPAITCPGTQIRYADANCEALIENLTNLVQSSDNCTNFPAISQDIDSTIILSGHNDAMLITLTAGIGGSLLSIGSAAGVALMGQARGYYTFASHLKWTPVIALGYGASIWVHLLLNG